MTGYVEISVFHKDLPRMKENSYIYFETEEVVLNRF